MSEQAMTARQRAKALCKALVNDHRAEAAGMGLGLVMSRRIWPSGDAEIEAQIAAAFDAHARQALREVLWRCCPTVCDSRDKATRNAPDRIWKWAHGKAHGKHGCGCKLQDVHEMIAKLEVR